MISVIQSKSQQANGSFLVVENHTADNGEQFVHTYFIDSDSLIDDICTQRGLNIQKELDNRALILAESTNFEIPLTPVEIMRRLTPQEWHLFQSSIDLTVAYFREVFNKTTQIYRNDPLTQAGFKALVDVGVLTTERVSEVLSG